MLRLAPLFPDPSVRFRHDARTQQVTVIQGYAQWGQRRLANGSPGDLWRVQRALVAIEQASRQLEAHLERAAHECEWH